MRDLIQRSVARSGCGEIIDDGSSDDGIGALLHQEDVGMDEPKRSECSFDTGLEYVGRKESFGEGSVR